MISQMQKVMSKEINIDTKILVIYLTGLYIKQTGNDISIEKLGNTMEDFYVLEHMLPLFKSHITPHVLVETYRVLQREYKNYAINIIKNGFPYLIHIEETNIPKQDILAHSFFEKVGITDTALVNCFEKHNHFVLTDERQLEGMMRSKDLGVITLEELRGFFANLPNK